MAATGRKKKPLKQVVQISDEESIKKAAARARARSKAKALAESK